MLAASHSFGAHMGWEDMAIALPIAERAALAAISADSEDCVGALALASVYLFKRRFDDSLAEFELALQLNPNFSLAQGYYGMTYPIAGGGRKANCRAPCAATEPARSVFGNVLWHRFLRQFLGRNYEEAMRLANEGIRNVAISSAPTACSPPPQAWPGRTMSPRPHCRNFAVRSPTYHSPGSKAKCRSAGRRP